jgi:hypothetical protein
MRLSLQYGKKLIGGLLGILLKQAGACIAFPNNEAVAQAMPRPGFGAIYIGRPMTMSTSLFALPIELDGKPLTSLGPSQYVVIELKPGRPQSGLLKAPLHNRPVSVTPQSSRPLKPCGKKRRQNLKSKRLDSD